MKKAVENENVAADHIVEKLVNVLRTAKVVKGGREFRFSALVVAGGDGKIGFGIGKSAEVPAAINKATEKARRDMSEVYLKDKTIQHEIMHTLGAAKVFMKPASPGTGVIAGNAMRAVFEVVGVEDILAKCIGTTNPVNVVRATIQALKGMATPESVAEKRGKSVEEILEHVDA